MRADRKIQNRAIQRFVKNNTRKNKARNVILVIAVVLVTILMTVMFGAGISIFHNFQLANLRTAGTKANGGLYMATEKEMEQISALDEVEATGKQQFVGEVLDVKGMPSQTIISMTAYDETEWENFIKPTVSDITGNYPRQESEVMLSRWTLEKLEVDDPQIGMTISVKYKLLSGEEKQQEFTLSGYYTDFIYETGVTPNSGNTMAANLYFINHSMSKRAAGNMIVSSRFAEEHGKEEGGLGTFLIDDRLNAEEALALLDHAAGNDEIFVSGLSGTAAQALMGAMIPILAVIFVMISGYLLIYNIINISVLQEMHMYGQLKALGATSKQLKKIVRKQVNLVAAVGIILGLLFGTAFAVITVPKFLEALMNSQNGKFEFGITVSPLIYVFTVLFAYMTVWFSARKGMRLAGKVSPTEALKYVDVVHKIKGHKGSGGGKLYRMAYRNVFRSRKRALVTFASLFFGLLIYLTVSSSTQKLDYNLKYDREMPYDFVMEDISWQLGNEEKAEKSLDDGILEKVKNLEGVDKIETDYVEVTKVEEAEQFLAPYAKLQALYSGAEEEVWSDLRFKAVGLSMEKLQEFTWNSTLPDEEIQNYLESGTGIFLVATEGSDYREFTGKEIQVSKVGVSVESITYTVVGILTKAPGEEGKTYKNQYLNYGTQNGSEISAFYTSEQGAERIDKTPHIQTIRIDCKAGTQGDISTELKEMAAQMDSVMISSKSEIKAGVDQLAGVIRAAGTVLGGFLIFMGLANFINVIFTGIYSRQKELAALESIGMTRKQIKITLILEGVYYCGITMVLLMTVGEILSYLIFLLIKNGVIYFAVYSFPAVQMLCVFVILVIVCVTVPLVVLRSVSKESLAERLRKGQD